MRSGKLEEGTAVLRAKIDMASPNINMRDPAIYRIKHAQHHNTGDKWCIYPMYTYAHPIEDALEKITHSICTLEFEDQRPVYDWVLERLCEVVTLQDGRTIGGLLAKPLPHQYEFARLNLTTVVTSKRKLKQLVDNHHVQGWDDPRMPTLVGMRRRGYTPEAIRLFCERIGVSKAASWIDYSTLEVALRDDLENKAQRAMAVLDPVKLTLTNWAEEFGSDDYALSCKAPRLPSDEEAGERHFNMARQVWIEREDFEETPPKGYRRLFPGNQVRLKYGCIVECTGCVKDEQGNVVEVLATVVHDTVSGTAGAAAVKVKGTITWVGVADAEKAVVRLYERLFTDEHPDAGGKDYLTLLNPESLMEKEVYLEPGTIAATPETHFQFERLGYFVTDRKDHSAGTPVFNRVTTLKDQWKK
ncbi:MAG: glutamine--tRNA ligase, partial [Saezia sp.]